MVREKAVLPGIVATALNSTSGYCENSTFVMAYRMSLRDASLTFFINQRHFQSILQKNVAAALVCLAQWIACAEGSRVRFWAYAPIGGM